MAKTPKYPADPAATAGVKVRIKCTYSGFPGDPGPGDTIEVDADEAARLVDLNAAELITE